MQKRIISIAIALLLAFGLFGCTAKQEQPAQAEPVQTAEEPSAAEETVPKTPAASDVEPQTAAKEPASAPAAEEAQQIQTAAVEGPAEQSAPAVEAQNAQEAPAQGSAEPAADPAQPAEEPASSGLADGNYSIAVGFSGGTGKASINSPATLIVTGGQYYAKLVWTSVNYDYMIVGGVKYLNENNGGYSTFTVPVPAMDTYVSVIGDTLAMSTPHEVEYTLYFDSTSIQ